MSTDLGGFMMSTTSALSPYAAGGQGLIADEQAIAVANKALANANSAVAQDKRNNSPDCVACDQKIADKAAASLADARKQARADGVVDITV